MKVGETSSRDLSISNAGGGTLTWTVGADQRWINVYPQSGTNSDTVTINIDTADLSPGSYTGTITVTSNGGTMIGEIFLTIPSPMPVVTPTPILSPVVTPRPAPEENNIARTPEIFISPGELEHPDLVPLIIVIAISTTTAAVILKYLIPKKPPQPKINIETRGGIESMYEPDLQQYPINVEVRGGIERL